MELSDRRTLGQIGENVSWRDTVDPDLVVCPFNSEGSSHVSNSGLGEIVWSLGLGDIDNLLVSGREYQMKKDIRIQTWNQS